MKKNLILLFYFIFIFTSQGQKFNGYVVTNENDTINCKFFVGTNFIYKKMFYPSSVKRKVKILNNKGEKITYKPHELISFCINETDRGSYKFVSIQADNYRDFFHVAIEGKITLLYTYIQNMDSSETPREYYYKNYELYETDWIDQRNQFGLLIKDNKELYEKWMDSNNFFKLRQIPEVIKLYNESFIIKNN